MFVLGYTPKGNGNGKSNLFPFYVEVKLFFIYRWTRGGSVILQGEEE